MMILTCKDGKLAGGPGAYLMKEHIVPVVLGLKQVHSMQHEKPFSLKWEMSGTAALPFASIWACCKRKGSFL